MLSTISKDNLAARVKKMIVVEETLVASKEAPGGVHVESGHDEDTTLDLIRKRKRLEIPTPSGHSHSDWRGPEVEIFSIQEHAEGSSKVRASIWDPGFDVSAHYKSCFLLEDNVSRLNKLDVGRLCGDVEGLLGKGTTLVCLANAKVKERKKAKEQKIEQIFGLQKENTRLHQEVDHLRVDVTRWAQEKDDLGKQMEDLKERSTQRETGLLKTIDDLKGKEVELLKRVDALLGMAKRASPPRT